MHSFEIIALALGVLLDAFLASLVWVPKQVGEASFKKLTGRDPVQACFLITLLSLGLSMQVLWPLHYTAFGWTGFWVLSALGMVAWDFRRIARFVLESRRGELAEPDGEQTGP